METEEPKGAGVGSSEEIFAPEVADRAWERMIEGIVAGDAGRTSEFLAQYSRGARVIFKHHLGPLGLDRWTEEAMSGALAAIRRGRISTPTSLVVFFRRILARQHAPQAEGGAMSSPVERVRIRRKADLLANSLRLSSNRDREMLTRLFVGGEPEGKLLEEYGVSQEDFARLKRGFYDAASPGDPPRRSASRAMQLTRSAASGR